VCDRVAKGDDALVDEHQQGGGDDRLAQAPREERGGSWCGT
jgi:hypothetical protein